MRILFINTLYYPNQVGGAEKSVQLLAEQMYANGHTAIVISTSDTDSVSYINGVKIYYLKHRNLYWGAKTKQESTVKKVLWHSLDVYNPFIKRQLDKIIDVEKPSLIHTNNLTGFSCIPWISAKERKLPVVHTLRDYSLLCSKGTMFSGSNNCKQRCNSCSLFTNYKKKLSNEGFVQHLVGNSQFIIDRHKSNGYFNNVKSVRIFNGAEILDKSDSKYERSNKLKFLYLGRIEESKGVNLILDVIQNYPQIELFLAGKVYDQKIEEGIKSGSYKKNIHFLGFIDPKEVIPQMDAVLVPSLWHEPLARSVLEAYSFGKPVIGSNRGGNVESIIRNKTGFIFEPNDLNSLINIIDNIISSPEILSSMNAPISELIQGFSVSNTIEQYTEVYREITNF